MKNKTKTKISECKIGDTVYWEDEDGVVSGEITRIDSNGKKIIGDFEYILDNEMTVYIK